MNFPSQTPSNMGETISLDDYTTLPGKSGATHSISLCIAIGDGEHTQWSTSQRLAHFAPRRPDASQEPLAHSTGSYSFKLRASCGQWCPQASHAQHEEFSAAPSRASAADELLSQQAASQLRL